MVVPVSRSTSIVNRFQGILDRTSLPRPRTRCRHGNGVRGFSGDGGLATNAMLDGQRGVAVDTSGNLFIADSNNGRVRKVAAG